MAKTTNIVPEGWTLREAESLYDRLRTPRVYDRNQVNQSGKYPIIDQSESGCIGYLDEIPDFDCSQDMPLTTFANHTCAVRQMKRPFGVIQNVFPLKAKPDVSQHFLYQIINRAIPQNGYKGHYPELRETQFLTPPLPEQQKIATILTSVDTVIEKTRAQIDKLTDLKTGMMQELLTKGIGHTEFKNTPIGRIPKEWDVAAIADIARLTSGGTPNRENSDYWNGDVLWVKTGEVNYQTIFDTEEKITVLGLKDSSAKLVPAGAILMAMYGQGITRGKVAKLGVPAAMNQACLAMIPNNQIINDFLYYFLSREYFNLRSMVQEGAQKNLSASIIKEILLPVPPRKEQQKIVDVLQSIDTKIMTASQKLISVEQTKKALMQDLLIGKIRVKLGSLGAFIE